MQTPRIFIYYNKIVECVTKSQFKITLQSAVIACISSSRLHICIQKSVSNLLPFFANRISWVYIKQRMKHTLKIWRLKRKGSTYKTHKKVCSKAKT